MVSLLHSHLSLTNLLVAQFNFQLLELNLLGQRVVLAVVLHLVQLHLIALHAGLSLLNLALFHHDSILELSNLVLDFLHTSHQARNLVFQVLHLQGQFAAQCAFLVDARESSLQLIKRFQLLFY